MHAPINKTIFGERNWLRSDTSLLNSFACLSTNVEVLICLIATGELLNIPA